MARINLLPWREEERARRNKEFITLVVAVTLLSLLAAFATWSYFNNFTCIGLIGFFAYFNNCFGRAGFIINLLPDAT